MRRFLVVGIGLWLLPAVADAQQPSVPVSAAEVARGDPSQPLLALVFNVGAGLVRAIAADLGYRPILWTIDSGDWTREATPESVYSHIMGGASNGAIIVCHFDSPNTLTSTALVLPAVIDALRESGYQLVTITELLTE